MFKFCFDRRIFIGFVLALAVFIWLVAILSFITLKELPGARMVANATLVAFFTKPVMAKSASIESGVCDYIQLQKSIHLLRPFSSSVTGLQKKTINVPFIIQLSLRKSASLRQRVVMDGIVPAKQFNYLLVGLLLTIGVTLVVMYIAIRIAIKKEKQLMTVAAEARYLCDNTICGYHSLDTNGYFIKMNNTLMQWLGYKPEEVLGKMKFIDIIPIEEHPLFHQRFEQFKQSGDTSDIQLSLLRKDGSNFPVLLNTRVIRAKNGKYIGTSSITIDVTEQKEAETKIRNLNREMEAFTYSVSHDLRAPLRSIDGYAKILQEDYLHKFDDEGKQIIQVIMSNAQRMSKLIDNLLDFSRLGRKDISLMQLNMTQMVKNIAQELNAREPDRQISIEVNPLLPCMADPDMMHQVWENLLSNAIKFTGKVKHATIEISSFKTEDALVYRIQDNGVGFDMQYVGKLFNVFQRLHKVQEFSGTGIGLAIVKRIINRHGGGVSAEGKVNGGAIFYFTIPKQ
jgi:PAS domain S-box-containing protein